METQSMLAQSKSQKIDLINGNFRPSDAFDLVSSVIESNINIYKLQYLSAWEKNHNISADSYNKRLSDLKLLRKNLKQIVSEARANDSSVFLAGTFNIEIVK